MKIHISINGMTLDTEFFNIQSSSSSTSIRSSSPPHFAPAAGLYPLSCANIRTRELPLWLGLAASVRATNLGLAAIPIDYVYKL